MTYVDVTLTPAATYTYVHNGQIYDQIATTLAAHGNWQYVEYVDSISGGTTLRRHVWRCKSAGSGLPSDFYVMFETRFTTATGVFQTNQPIYPIVAEGYSAGTLSKMASNYASITPASDLTNPATWALSANNPPATVCSALSSNYSFVSIGPNTNTTSIRLLYIVAKDGLMTNWASDRIDVTSPGAAYPIYMGAYDTLLGANDPMPLVIWQYKGQGTTAGAGGATRAPFQTAGVAVTEVFSLNHYHMPGSGGTLSSANPKISAGTGGSLGASGTTTWVKSDGGVQALRTYLSSFTSSTPTNSAKGIIRGYSKYVRICGSVAAHSMGDTFLIDGKVYLGLGAVTFGFWDTTAA